MADQNKTGSGNEVFLICDASDAFMCDALSDGLSKLAKERKVVVVESKDALPEHYNVAIQFVEEKRSDDLIIGHLSWGNSKGTHQVGPSLEQTVMDASRSQALLQDYAFQLLTLTDIKLGD